MAGNQLQSESIKLNGESNINYKLPLALMVTLFFVFGIITVLNDILIPHFRSTFSLSYGKAMLINGFFFGAYFVMGIPSSIVINRFGYRNAIVIGLIVVGLGCLSFYPASLFLSYYLFLTSLFFIASGITLLQVAANAYVTVLGPPEKSSARISLCGGLNSTATIIGPIVGASLILNQGMFNEVELKAQQQHELKYKTELLTSMLSEAGAGSLLDSLREGRQEMHATDKDNLSALLSSDAEIALLASGIWSKSNSPDAVLLSSTEEMKRSYAAVKEEVNKAKAEAVPLPYIILAGFVFLVAFVFSRVNLPSLIQSSDKSVKNKYSAWSFRHLRLGVLAIFIYVGAEVVIGSLLINFIGLKNILGLPEHQAAIYVTMYWGCAAVARFIGFAALQKVRPVPALITVSGVAALLVIVSIFSEGMISLLALVSVGLCHSIMWPVIFSLSLDGLGKYKTQASGLLIMGVVGGAVIPIIQGILADTPAVGLQNSFWVTVACYVYLLYYALAGYKNVNKEMTAEAEGIKENKKQVKDAVKRYESSFLNEE